MTVRAVGLLGLWLAILLGGCGEGSKPPTSGEGDPDRGRQVYLAQCISCHNSDPSRDGPLGPAVKGSSRELIEARLLRGSYPKGYQPKRDTALMQPMPQLAGNIPDLAAYLR